MRSPGVSVVIDTNVWISGLISMAGAPAQLTRRIIRSRQPVFSDSTFDDLRDRLWRPKFDRYVSMEQRHALLANLDAMARWVKISPEIAVRTLCRDPDDDKFIHVALAAQPVWLITGDQDLLVLAQDMASAGVTIISPAEALASTQFVGATGTI